MSCPNCEKARQEGKTFCTQCGERLIPETPAPPPQQANREPAPQQRSQWSGVYQEPAQTPAPNPVPPPAYTPYAAVPPEPKKKRSVLPIIVIALLVAALGAVAVLFATGVISFGGEKEAEEEDEPTASAEPSDEPSAEPEAQGPYTIGETKLVDNEYCTATLMEVYETDSSINFRVNILNNDSRARTVYAGVVATDGIMLGEVQYEKLTSLGAGKSSDCTVVLDKDLMDTLSVSETADYVVLNIAMDNDPDTEPVYLFDDYVDVYPTGRTASQVSYAGIIDFARSDEVLRSSSADVDLFVASVDEDGLTFGFTVKNKLSAHVALDIDNIVIDGVAYDDYFLQDVLKKHGGYLVCTIDRDTLEDMGLDPDAIGSVTFDVAIWDWDSFEDYETCSYTAEVR